MWLVTALVQFSNLNMNFFLATLLSSLCSFPVTNFSPWQWRLQSKLEYNWCYTWIWFVLSTYLTDLEVFELAHNVFVQNLLTFLVWSSSVKYKFVIMQPFGLFRFCVRVSCLTGSAGCCSTRSLETESGLKRDTNDQLVFDKIYLDMLLTCCSMSKACSKKLCFRKKRLVYRSPWPRSGSRDSLSVSLKTSRQRLTFPQTIIRINLRNCTSASPSLPNANVPL